MTPRLRGVAGPVVTLAVALVTFHLGAGQAAACSCLSIGTATEELASAAAVFVGTVVFVEDVNEDVEELERFAGWQMIAFDVTESWKGADAGTVRLVTPHRLRNSCGLEFHEGERWLVFALYSMGPVPMAMQCTWTSSLDDAQAHDVLRALGPGTR